jgi:hypothetical protein
MNPRYFRNSILTLILVAVGFALLYLVVFRGSSPPPIAYSGGNDSFLGLVKSGQVRKVVQRGGTLEITLRETDVSTKQPKVRTSQIPGEFATNIREDIAAVCNDPDGQCNPPPEIAAADPPPDEFIGLILTGLLPVILIGVFLFFMIRRAEVTSAQGITGGPGGGARPPPAAAEQPVTVDIPDQIRKLAQLRDEGILTPEEFAAKKAELLKRM